MYATLIPVPSSRSNDIADGYVYECSCGELYNSVIAADRCGKCRNYCVFGYCTHVIDIRSGDLVYGEVPDIEEYEAAEAFAVKRWAEERRELEVEKQMAIDEDKVYAAAAAEKAADRQEEDLWNLQDRMMGI